jgi:hypothetical protein
MRKVNFLISLTQFGDGAVGGGPLTGANELALKLASGTTVFWDMQSPVCRDPRQRADLHAGRRGA